MHDENCITLYPVANDGWVVTLPNPSVDPMAQSIKAGVEFAKAVQQDPMLHPTEPEERDVNEITLDRDNNTRVFLSTKDMLSFLNYHLNK